MKNMVLKNVMIGLFKCPECGLRDLKLNKNKMNADYTFHCPQCNSVLYLTDIFGLQNSVNEELGVGETAHNFTSGTNDSSAHNQNYT